MRAGAHAYIALSSTGLERELEDYVLVRHPDGSWFFSNDCGFDLLTQPMRDRLGDDYGPTIEDVLGRTRNGVVRALHAHGFDE
jgi:hypothetical protein